MMSLGKEMAFFYFGYTFVQPPFIFMLSNNALLACFSAPFASDELEI